MIRTVFERIGELREIRMPPTNREWWRRGAGHAYVKYVDEAHVGIAVALNGTKIGGSKISVVVQKATKQKAINALLVQAPRPDSLLDVVDAHAADLSTMNLATALHHYSARLYQDARPQILDAPRLGNLLERITSSIADDSWEPRSLAVATRAAARLLLGDADHDFHVYERCRFTKEDATPATTSSAALTIPDLCKSVLEAVILHLSESNDVSEILKLASDDGASGALASFSPRDAVMTARALWTVRKKVQLPFSILAAFATSLSLDEAALAKLDPQSLATAAWTYGSVVAEMGLDYRLGSVKMLLDAVGATLAVKVHLLKAQELSIAIWSFATAEILNEQLFEAVASAATPHILRECSDQGLANIAWAYSRAGVVAPGLFEDLAIEVVTRIETFSPQALATTAWAFSTAFSVYVPTPLGPAEARLYDNIAGELANRAAECNAQDLAMVSWAFATAACSAPHLFEAIANVSIRKIYTFDAQALSNVTWAFAKAGFPAPDLFDAIARRIMAVPGDARVQKPAPPRSNARRTDLFAEQLNAQALSNIAWAFSKAGIFNAALFDVLAQQALAKVATFEAQGLTNMVWAFTSQRFEAPPAFLAAAADELVRDPAKRGRVSPGDVCGFCLELADARVPHGAFFDAVSMDFLFDDDHRCGGEVYHGDNSHEWYEWQLKSGFQTNDVAKLLQACAIAQFDAPDVFEKAARQLTQDRLRADLLSPAGVAAVAWAFANAPSLRNFGDEPNMLAGAVVELFDVLQRTARRKADLFDEVSLDKLCDSLLKIKQRCRAFEERSYMLPKLITDLQAAEAELRARLKTLRLRNALEPHPAEKYDDALRRRPKQWHPPPSRQAVLVGGPREKFCEPLTN